MTSDKPTASWGRFHQFCVIIQNTIFIWLNIPFESDGVAIWRISHGTNCGLATGTQVRLLDNGMKLFNADVLLEGLVGSILGWGLMGDLFVTGTSSQVPRPTVPGSRNLTNGLQVLQFDNGLELSNPLSLYPAEGWLLRIRFWINIFSFYYKLINFPLPHWDNNSDTLKMNFRLGSANLHLCIV